MMDLSQKTCGQDVIQVGVGENESLGLRQEQCLNKEKRKRLFSRQSFLFTILTKIEKYASTHISKDCYRIFLTIFF